MGGSRMEDKEAPAALRGRRVATAGKCCGKTFGLLCRNNNLNLLSLLKCICKLNNLPQLHDVVKT